ncbi:putative polysaccharide biosynthesis protein [Anaerosinus massiliensis]|uniref:putative polysaccharide biosynthesis protein n=1 Tax=Massilibacillus massiliensis TaxID=1806837 RepID=UPI000A8CE236|nr:polysaccharide biosynthesis protein [Massilibacillus massiliensis]
MLYISNQGEKANTSESFLKGTFILAIAGIVVKVIGSLNWIFVSRVLGGEGIGLYQMAFPIYLLALSISTAGVPVAISIITAEKIALKDIWGAKRIFRISLALMAVTGLFFSLATYFGAGFLIEYRFIRDPRAYYSVAALAPAIFFVTLLASSRGYLQGWQRMTPTAVSQIVEQIFRVITMILFANLLLPQGLEFAAAGASLGACAGAVAGVIVLIYYHWQLERDITREYSGQIVETKTKHESSLKIIRRIFALALPVSASSIMLPVVANLDLMIVPARLEVAGYSVSQATELFGYLTGMAVPLINLATILTASLAVSIVPAISEAQALGDKLRSFQQTSAAMRISNLISFPAFIIVFMLDTPISELIYNATGAGPTVRVLSTSIVLLGIHQVTTGVLQGLGHTSIPMMNMIIAAIAKVALNWGLTAQPALGIQGAAWATVADIGIAAIMNLYFLHKYIGYNIDLKQVVKTIFATTLMGISLYFSYLYAMAYFQMNSVATLGSILVGCIVYVVVLIFIGGISQRDVERVPMVGSILTKLLRRIGAFK